MGNTEDTKDVELKKIPRNPNIPLKDEEVDALLKKAAAQVSEKEISAGMKSSSKADIKAGSKDVKPEKKPEEKSSRSSEDKKIPEFKKKESDDAKRENIKLTKATNQNTTDKKGKNDKVVGKQSSDLDSKATKNLKDVETKTQKSNADKLNGKSVENKDLKQVDSVSKDTKKASKDEMAKVDFKIEDDVYVTGSPSKKEVVPNKNYKMSVGDIIGAIIEGIWTGIKLIVFVAIVTAVVGFFMSRDLMIRGRSGEQISKQGMNVAAATLSTRLEERKSGKTWNETVKKEKLTLEADDGKILVAQKIVVDKKNDNWVVILHGQNGSVEDIYDIGFRYATEGYNILMPDLRAHGESEGSFYGMGWLDRLDVINWIDVILEDEPSANIIIHGVDLGGNTALMLSGEPLKDSIKVIVAEGAYTSAWEAVKTEYKARHEDWPTFPMMYMLNPVAKVWGGYSLTEANAVEQVKKTSVPILLIRGQNDTYISEAMTTELDQAIASEHEVFTIATGTHEDCRFAEPDTYYNKVFEFVGTYVQ